MDDNELRKLLFHSKTKVISIICARLTCKCERRFLEYVSSFIAICWKEFSYPVFNVFSSFRVACQVLLNSSAKYNIINQSITSVPAVGKKGEIQKIERTIHNTYSLKGRKKIE